MNASPAPAGAGTPVLNPADLCGCSAASILSLNRASLSAQQTASESAAIHPNRGAVCSDHRNRISAGAVPNAILSLKLSTSAPTLVCARPRRAIRPSSPSSTPGSAISASARSHSPLMARLTPVSPRHSASAVIALGIIARNEIPRGPPSSVMRRSLADARQRSIDADLCDHGLAGDRALAEQDLGRGPGGQIDVDPAAEADQADALTRFDDIAFLDERQDSPRNQPGDLGEADASAVRSLDQEMLALIVLARLVEVGVNELARHVGDALDSPRDRRAIDVNVEHAHENRDAR